MSMGGPESSNHPVYGVSRAIGSEHALAIAKALYERRPQEHISLSHVGFAGKSLLAALVEVMGS